MSQLLQLFVLLPLLGFLISMLIYRKKEKTISWVAISTTCIHLAGIILFCFFWMIKGFPTLNIKQVVLYKTNAFEFFINFYFDKITAVYACVGSFIILVVCIFSRYYLHRDDGFKRFFNTLLLFFTGYSLVVFSGNFETLFVGWEILGFCSFLLIAFYRDRYLPVKNALKVISIYRIGDVCLMLAIWMCHHLFHENITFIQINDPLFIAGHLPHSTLPFIFTSLMILFSAAAKSAMLPFCSWLPRAMEGPTTSSAVFYGSLSVHLGAFLLLRTHPFWDDVLFIKITVIALGLLTSIVATAIARVQSSVKTQIAYSSITQIGLIFIEIALGYHTFALIHFAGNAFLRTYQLLVSPSVLSYQIHDMFFTFSPRKRDHSKGFRKKLKNTVYILSIKEWNLDRLMYRFLWTPFKFLGRFTQFLVKRFALVLLGISFLIGILSVIAEDNIPDQVEDVLTLVFSLLGFLLVSTAFAERGDARKAWVLVVAAQCFITLAIALNNMPVVQVIIYLSGIVVSSIGGYACLHKIGRIDESIRLDRFHGYVQEKPKVAFLFLLCCLGLLAFPFTPTFLGIDLLFTNIHKNQFLLILLTALSFIIIEIAVLRIYARVFLGQHKKNYHPIAFRSS